MIYWLSLWFDKSLLQAQLMTTAVYVAKTYLELYFKNQ
jgi:hypothetical protein